LGEKDILDIQEARTFEKLVNVALRVLARMPGEIALVCGPVTGGNRRSQEENRRRIFEVIAGLRRRGVAVFNHHLLERQAEKILMVRDGDREKLRQDFYLRILECRRVKKLYLTAGWRHSADARWWHENATRLGKNVIVIQPKESGKAADM
jgi:hypothetical protein